MRWHVAVGLMLVSAGCMKNEMRLMAAVATLETQVEQKQLELARATGRAERPDGGYVRALPMAPPEIPEPSMFEGSEAGRLRAKIVNLEAENARLDAMIAMLEVARADGGQR